MNQEKKKENKIINIRKLPKHSSTGDWLNTLQYIYMMETCAVIAKNEEGFWGRNVQWFPEYIK